DAPQYMYRWFRNGAVIPGQTGSTLTGSSFNKGDSIVVEITPFDGTASGTPRNSTAVSILNSAPSTTTAISPDSTTDTTPLITWVEGIDPDGDAVTYYICIGTSSGMGDFLAWKACVLPQYQVISNMNQNSNYFVQIIITDGISNSSTREETIFIASSNSPPTAPTSISPDSSQDITPLISWSGATDPDVGQQIYYYIRIGTATGSGDVLPWTYCGNETYQVGIALAVSLYYVEVKSFDGILNSSTSLIETVEILNSAPSISGVGISPWSPLTTDNLTASAINALDINDDPISFTYRWFRNGTILGVTTNVLPSLFFDKWDVVTCEITPHDSIAGIPRNGSVIIVNTPPSISSVSLSPGIAYKNTPLSATITGWSDADGDLASYFYKWYVSGSPVATTASVLDPIYFNKGDIVYCVVTPNDGEINGTTIISNTVIIQNSPPSISNVSITPALAHTDDTLNTVPSGAADADGDSVSFIYTWWVGGMLVPGQASSNLSGIYFTKNVNVSCQVTPFDGTTYGTPINGTIEIQNAAPLISNASISPGTAYETSTLAASASGWSDADGDAPQYTYRWFRNGTVIPGQTGSTLTGSSFNKGDSIVVEITPFDGTTSGTPRNSTAVSILNSAPQAPTSLTPRATTDLTPFISWTGFSDPDGDTLQHYLRIVNASNPGQVILGWSLLGTPSYQVIVPLTLHSSYLVQVACWDGTINSTIFQDFLNTTNTAPYWPLPANHVAPNSTTNTRPVITWDAAIDPDNQTVTYEIIINSTLTGFNVTSWCNTGTTTSFMPSIDLAVGNYTIQIRANDGIEYSIFLVEPLEILNTAPTFASVSLNTTVAWETSTIVALPAGFSDINTGDDGRWVFEWLVNGTPVLQGVTDTLFDAITINGTYFSKHDVVSCRIQAMDTHGGISTPITSETVSIANSLPIITSLDITRLGVDALQNDTYTGQASAFDADGDLVQFTYHWYVAPGGGNFTLVFTGPSLHDPNRAYFRAYDSIIVCAVPFDGETTGTPVNSSMIEIQNSKPGICSNAWLDTTGGSFIIPIVRWSPAIDIDGGFQTYEIYMGTQPLKADLLEMSRAGAPYTALCYRYVSNQSIYRGTIYVHIRAIDEYQLSSDDVLIFACTWDVPADRESQMSRNELLLMLGMSIIAVVGGLAIAFSVVKRAETAIDLEIPGGTKNLKSTKPKKMAGKSSSSYQQMPSSATQYTETANTHELNDHGTTSDIDYRNVLKEKMERVKVLIDGKDYTNALACLQEMIVIAEKEGDTLLANNYKNKFEEILRLSVE
ncbi:MAG: hypothetical protein GYA24_02570, partial [Candidatus Lokiarchaeota archaeon]|nr:hypothetical protein [Candidatus Lokiarchaeota archaeon]